MTETTGFDAHFAWWPVLSVVERHGVDHPAHSVPALRALTRRFTAEFAVRPFLDRDPAGTLAVLSTWVTDPCPHVRRLVSEGTRPRLPWGPQLRAFVADPSPVIPLLDALAADPELYVRRSVANHLGDIAKDHPDRAVAIAARWQAAHDTAEVAWVVRHGLRHLVKKGHVGALALQGYGPPRLDAVQVSVGPDVVVVGGAVQVGLSLVSQIDQQLVVDLVLGLRRKDGSAGAKVFKWTTVALAAGDRWHKAKSLPLRDVSTRRYYAGEQTVTVQINGQAVGGGRFVLEVPAAG